MFHAAHEGSWRVIKVHSGSWRSKTVYGGGLWEKVHELYKYELPRPRGRWSENYHRIKSNFSCVKCQRAENFSKNCFYRRQGDDRGNDGQSTRRVLLSGLSSSNKDIKKTKYLFKCFWIMREKMAHRRHSILQCLRIKASILKMSHIMYNIWCATFHMPCVTGHMSRVIFHVSPVTCHRKSQQPQPQTPLATFPHCRVGWFTKTDPQSTEKVWLKPF